MTLAGGVFFALAFNGAGVEGVFFVLAGDGGGVGNGRIASVLMRMCLEMISSILGAMELRRFLLAAKLIVDVAGDTGSAGAGGLCNLCRLGVVLSGEFGIISSVLIVFFGGRVAAFDFGF